MGQSVQKQLPAGSQVDLGGAVFSIEAPGLSVTEAIGLVVALVVLVLTLGSLVAAGLPLLTAVFGVGLTMALMTVSARFTDVNSTAPILAVMLGLAVGIDYALFILSRHRDQLRSGMSVEESAAESVATAGSAVVFAGLTVVIALVGLTLAGIPFLSVMGVFAAIGVAIGVVVALTMLPAAMGFLGGGCVRAPAHAHGTEAPGNRSLPVLLRVGARVGQVADRHDRGDRGGPRRPERPGEGPVPRAAEHPATTRRVSRTASPTTRSASTSVPDTTGPSSSPSTSSPAPTRSG